MNGQKIIKKTITNPLVRSVSIDLTNCYGLELNSAKSNEIQVQASIAGADNDDVLVNIEENGSNIGISSGFRPNHIARTSKFGALTYVAIDLKIAVPKNLLVRLFGTSTQVLVNGEFRRLELSLADGNCVLLGSFESAMVRTQKGDIALKSAAGTVKAKSSYGEVLLGTIPEGGSAYELNSVQGNIYVNQTD